MKAKTKIPSRRQRGVQGILRFAQNDRLIELRKAYDIF